MTPEGKIKEKVKRILDGEEGVYYFFPAANGFGRTAIPDIIICVRGKFLAVECKAGTKDATALQQRELSRIKDAGGTGIVINETNVEHFGKFIGRL